MAIVVAIYDIAYRELLILPVGVGSCGVVLRLNILTVGIINEVCTIVEVDNLVGVLRIVLVKFFG